MEKTAPRPLIDEVYRCGLRATTQSRISRSIRKCITLHHFCTCYSHHWAGTVHEYSLNLKTLFCDSLQMLLPWPEDCSRDFPWLHEQTDYAVLTQAAATTNTAAVWQRWARTRYSVTAARYPTTWAAATETHMSGVTGAPGVQEWGSNRENFGQLRRCRGGMKRTHIRMQG